MSGQLLAASVGAAAGLVVSPLLWTVLVRTSTRPLPAGAAPRLGVAVAAAAAGGWGAGWAGGEQAPLAWWALLVVGVGLGVVDARERRLPNTLVAAAAGGVAGGVLVEAAHSGSWAGWWQAVAVGGVVFVLLYLLALFGDLGFGDVKLGAVAAGCAGVGGPGAAAAVLIVGFLVTAIAGLIARRGRRAAIPLGPGLVAGAAAVLPWL